MNTFRNHLNENLKDENFKNLYNQEIELSRISLKIHEEREKKKLTQKQLSKIAGITQQQLSKIENGISCNITTLIKTCKALNLRLEIV
ncbi:MAG: helix-turn-helix transcriptional regulator [Cyanobacteriota bacterium]